MAKQRPTLKFTAEPGVMRQGETLTVSETSRMLVRHLSQEDVPELASALADPEVMRYSVRGVLTKAQTKEFIDWCIGLYVQRGFGPWALIEKASGAFVGFCGLSSEIIDGRDEVHIGFRLSRQFWRQGLATEAVHAVLVRGFEWHALPSITAIVEPDHQASVRVLEKTGFSSFEHTMFHGRRVRVYRQQAADSASSHNNSLNPTGFSAGAPKPAD